MSEKITIRVPSYLLAPECAQWIFGELAKAGYDVGYLPWEFTEEALKIIPSVRWKEKQETVWKQVFQRAGITYISLHEDMGSGEKVFHFSPGPSGFIHTELVS